jgi:hypothetical protein
MVLLKSEVLPQFTHHQRRTPMKTWLMLAVVAVCFALPTQAEAHWRYRPRAFYGYGYPAYAYSPPSYYVAPRPVVVRYPRVVVRPVVAPAVVYRPVAYTAYYAPAPYFCGW